MRLGRGAWSASLLLCLALYGLEARGDVAHAEGADPTQASPVQLEQAQQRFLRAKALYEAGDFAAALDEFSASRAIVASPNTRLFRARCLFELGRILEAYAEYDRTMVHALELAKQDVRYSRTADAAAAERAALQDQLGSIRVNIHNPAPATRLFVNGEEIRRQAWAEVVPVQPGAVEVEVRTPGRSLQHEEAQVRAGEKAEFTLDAASAKSLAIGPSTQSQAPKSPEPGTGKATRAEGSPLTPLAFTAAGLGVVGFGAFGILGVLSQADYSALRRKCSDQQCPESERTRLEGGAAKQLWANVGLAVGAVASASAVTLWLLPGDAGAGSTKSAFRLQLSPVSVVLQGDL
jgi:tetratricopeptide (TPR) repeat protein